MAPESDASEQKTSIDPATLVPEKWREQFREYLATGSGSPEFFAFLDTDAAGQEAVEAALAQRAAAFDRFTTELKRVFQASDTAAQDASQLSDVAAVADLPSEKRSELVNDIVDAANHLTANARRSVRDFFRDVSQRLQ